MPASSEPPVFEPPAAGPFGPPRRRLLARRGQVNFLLIAGSVLVALFSSLGENRAWLQPLFISEYAAHSPEALLEVRRGEIWRLFTPIFIHFGVLHLGLNMLAMINIGYLLERVQKWRFYLVFTATVAVCSNVAEYYVSGQPSFGGMSGVIFGMFGFVWLRGLCGPRFLLHIPSWSIVLSLAWFGFGFSGVLPIANTAHAVGLVIGAAWGVVAGREAAGRKITAAPTAG